MASKTDFHDEGDQQMKKDVAELSKQTGNVENTEISQDPQTINKQDRGWAWIVLICSFWCTLILDGIVFTYGALFSDIVNDLQVADSLVALLNSLQLALYFVLSPLGSAMIAKFGFRTCTASGSIIASMSLLISYFTTNYLLLISFYGLIVGFGCALINMGAGLIVGFYFNRFRSIAFAVTNIGSSAGIAAFFPVSKSLVRIAGWRSTILLHSGLLGIIYFLALSFKPITKAEVNEVEPSTPQEPIKLEESLSKNTQNSFGVASNINVSTDPTIFKRGVIEPLTQSVPSTTADTANIVPSQISRLPTASLKHSEIITASQGNIQKPLTQMPSTISKSKVQVNVKYKTPEKQNFWIRLWHRGKPKSHHPKHQGDGYRTGRLESIKVHRQRDSVEYHIVVARETSTNIPITRSQEDRNSSAFKKIVASMMDTALLKKCSFRLLCSSNFFAHLGMLVPFVYLQDRNEQAGVDPKHCSFFISVASIFNAIGKLTLNALTIKIAVLKIYSVSIIIAGTSTMVSSLSYSLTYQYTYSAVFGFFVSVLSSMKSLVLVSLYGLDKLTTSTGMMLIFIGLGCLISTPIAGVFKNAFGYTVAFCFAGFCMALGGVIIIPIHALVETENNL